MSVDDGEPVDDMETEGELDDDDVVVIVVDTVAEVVIEKDSEMYPDREYENEADAVIEMVAVSVNVDVGEPVFESAAVYDIVGDADAEVDTVAVIVIVAVTV